jgi:hypothetical protein
MRVIQLHYSLISISVYEVGIVGVGVDDDGCLGIDETFPIACVREEAVMLVPCFSVDFYCEFFCDYGIY